MPRGDYWRPPMTDSRAHSYYRDGYRHREIEDSNHRFRSSRHRLSDPHHSRHEISRRDRSRSPARNTKRGRFRDRSPFRGRSRSRNGLHGLSGSKVLHQAEDSSGRHRFRTREFNGDRYIPSPKPTHPARRSPAPSPGRELTPPRRTRRNRSPRRRIPPNRSPRRPPPRTLPEHRSGRDLEHAPPIRSSHPLPDQLTAFQNSIRPLNTGPRRVAGSVFKGVHSADMRNSNLVQDSILTSPRRPGKRRRVEDEFPVQHKRSRGYEQSYDENVRDYNAPRSYGSR
ncbi:hypothetical protein HOY82DRAFT_567706 [Tuber indicum]|nr:hypothetical protein HOY82DRAFT_567706 [Tuber indicum]